MINDLNVVQVDIVSCDLRSGVPGIYVGSRSKVNEK